MDGALRAVRGMPMIVLDAFVARQASVPNPLMPLRLFRSREVAGANLVQAMLVVGMFGMFFLRPARAPAMATRRPADPETA